MRARIELAFRKCELSELLVSIDWWGEGRSGQQKGSSNFVFLVGLLNLGGRLAFPFGFFYTKIILDGLLYRLREDEGSELNVSW